MINCILYEKGIVLNKENNTKRVLANIATKGYTHVFTSTEIAFLKKFKQNILDKPSLTDSLYLFAVDEIYLVEKWGKNFCLIYAEIEKI